MSFETYKFDEDVNWKIYLEDALIPQNPNYYNALYKLKQKYYKRKIDPEYEIKEPIVNNTSSNANTNNTNTNTNNNTTQQRNTTSTSTSSSRTSNTNSNTNTNTNTNSNSNATRYSGAFSKYLLISWMISQVSVIVFTIFYLISNPTHFYRALLAGLIGYLISLFPTFEGLLPFSKEKLLHILQNDNFHYLFFCSMFYFMGVPSFMVLIPNFIYAFYHLLGRGLQLPNIRGSIPPAIYGKLQLVESKKSVALEYATRFEVYMIVYLFIGVFTRQASIFLLFNYYQFIKLRYQSSASTRECLTQYGMLIDQYIVNNQSLPLSIRNIIGKIKSSL